MQLRLRNTLRERIQALVRRQILDTRRRGSTLYYSHHGLLFQPKYLAINGLQISPNCHSLKLPLKMIARNTPLPSRIDAGQLAAAEHRGHRPVGQLQTRSNLPNC